jgi:hypothetical protein
MFGNESVIRALLKRGAYRKVATVKTPAGLQVDQILEDAWARSQNGIHVDNWLQESASEVFVDDHEAPSTSVGDIFVLTGNSSQYRFYVASFGFNLLP